MMAYYKQCPSVKSHQYEPLYHRLCWPLLDNRIIINKKLKVMFRESRSFLLTCTSVVKSPCRRFVSNDHFSLRVPRLSNPSPDHWYNNALPLEVLYSNDLFFYLEFRAYRSFLLTCTSVVKSPRRRIISDQYLYHTGLDYWFSSIPLPLSVRLPLRICSSTTQGSFFYYYHYDKHLQCHRIYE